MMRLNDRIRNLATFLFVLLSLPSTGSALTISISNHQELTQNELTNAKTLIQDVLQHLPKTFAQETPFEVSVGFKFLEGNSAVLGYVPRSSKSIVINRKTLDWNSRPVIGDFVVDYQLARLNLAHEIGHIFDEQGPPRDRVIPADCDRPMTGEVSQNVNHDLCQAYTSWTTRVSTDPQFLALTQLKKTIKGFERINNNNKSWPVSYANASNKETFAVLFSYFVFDPEFPERLPQLELYFSKIFGTEPRLGDLNRPLYWLNATAQSFVSTPINKIYKVDFLWASEGQGMASRYGHAMIRLVVCSPERTVINEECYKDVRHHIVLSYGALSREIEFKTMDGLSGKYPINLHASGLQDKQIEYNHIELRNLYALPLKLNRRQMLAFIYHLNFEHWHMDGKYYFVSRNCATEVGRGLLASGYGRDELFEIFSNNPRRLFQNLLKSKLSPVKSVDEIRRINGLFFASSQAYLNQALQNVRSLPEVAALKTVEEYSQMKDETVRAWLQSGQLDRKKLGSVIYLERWRYLRKQAQLEQDLLKLDSKVKETYEKRILEVNGKLYEDRFPARFIKSETHYGLPLADEINDARSSLARKIENFTKNETLISREVVKDIQTKLKPQRDLLNQLIKSY